MGEEIDENSTTVDHEHSDNDEVQLRIPHEDNVRDRSSLQSEPSEFDYNASDENEETSSSRDSRDSMYYGRAINHDLIFGSRIQRHGSNELVIVDNHYEVGIDDWCFFFWIWLLHAVVCTLVCLLC